MNAREAREVQELRYAVRAVMYTPWLAAVIVASLALGIGANAVGDRLQPRAGTYRHRGRRLGAAAGIRLARSFVYELPGLDAGLVAATTAALLVVVGVAVNPHALRALRINPVVVLRE
jgi:hypothetical protein